MHEAQHRQADRNAVEPGTGFLCILSHRGCRGAKDII
jgi:hypothetical protein